MSGAVTDDAFLGGRLKVLQPARGYRAGIDPVLLAAAVQAMPGETVLELGCGTGVVLLCLGARVGGLRLIGVERDGRYAELARRNAERNGIAAEVVCADLRELPAELRGISVDHVVANPPYLDRSRGLPGDDRAREGAVAEALPLARWIACGVRRLRPGGRLTLIHRAERLHEILSVLGGEGVVVRPIAARQGRNADRVLVSALKAGRAPFTLAAPLVVHAGPRHMRDGDDYSPAIRAVLREGAELVAPDQALPADATETW